jgi:hypothetical protein
VLAKLGVRSWRILASIGSPEMCSSTTTIADLVLRRNRTSGVLVQTSVRQTNSTLGYLLLIQKNEGFCVKPPTRFAWVWAVLGWFLPGTVHSFSFSFSTRLRKSIENYRKMIKIWD